VILILVPAGIVAGGRGIFGWAVSGRIRKRAKRRLEETSSQYESACESAQKRIDAYNLQKIEVVTTTIGRFADWMVRNKLNVNRLAHDAEDVVLIDAIQDLPQSAMSSEEIAGVVLKAGAGVIAAGMAAAGTQAAAIAAVTAFGTASTGTAISSLSGAAATNATMAWFAGGSIAAGGGGMAAGGVVLVVITAAPAVAILGFTAGILGSKARTKSKQFEADVEIACARIKTLIDLREAGMRRIDELSTVLNGLAKRLDSATDRLESLEFDADLHGDDFRQTMLLVRAIREVTTLHVIDPTTGELTEMSAMLMSRYR